MLHKKVMKNSTVSSGWIVQYLVCMIFVFCCSTAVYAKNSNEIKLPNDLQQQRKIFKTFNDVLASKDYSTAKKLLPQLKSYTLYPYAEYHYFVARIDKISLSQAKSFIIDNANMPFINNFITSFINELSKRKQWAAILQFITYPPRSKTARCQYYYAELLVGDKYQAFNGAKLLWLSGSNDSSICEPLFDAWKKAGNMTEALLKQRILLALKNKNFKLAQILINSLSVSGNTLKNSLLTLLTSPDTISSFVGQVAASSFSKQVVALMFNYLAETDVKTAQKAFAVIVKQYGYDLQQQQTMQESLAWQLFSPNTSQQDQTWRDAIIKKTHNVALVERRIRLAIGTNNDKDLAYWLKQLPQTEQQQQIWQYWYADVLIASKNAKEMAQGKEILNKLSHETGYYAMLSAQRLNQDYQLTVPNIAPNSSYWMNNPIIQRIAELMYWHKVDQANQLWLPLVAEQTKEQQASLASYALSQGWNDLSITATIQGKLWGNLQQRFPLSFHTLFVSALKGKKITEDYALAIGRQESLLNPLAISPVGAMGIMQLMPSTAKHIAKSQNEITYTVKQQLLNPKVNIYLGTLYLEYVYTGFNDNRVLSTASYNAGPTRVDQWLQRANGKLSVAQFIEAIPFKETRNYVKNVLSFSFYYRYLLGMKPTMLLTTSEYIKKY